MSAVPNPVARRRELGSQLREHRERKGLTLAEVAAEILCSTAKISRIENGQRPPTPRDMRDLLNLYEIADEGERRRFNDLAAKARERESTDLNAHPYIREYVSYEVEALTVRDFKGATIPGLLQTSEYARAVLATLFGSEPIAMNRLVNSRLERQRAVFGRSDPPQFHAVMDEAAIRRMVGGREVMRDQLAHLLESGQEPNITVQVIPFEAGSHLGMENTFTIFEMESEAGTQVVAYSEDVLGTVLLERPGDLENSLLIFEKVVASALSPDDTATLIQQAMEALS